MLVRQLRRLVPAPVTRADLRLFRWVARWRTPALDATLPRLSTAANHSALWLGSAALLGLRGGRFGRRSALRGLLVIAVTSASVNLPGKLLTARPRPDLTAVPEVRRLARVPMSTSFPSGHTASAVAFATAVGLELPRARWPLGLLAGAVALSRVYTGVHYPGDVLAGALVGGSVALASTRVWPLADDTPARGAPALDSARPGHDGEGLTIVANNAAGPALMPGPARRLRDALPAARVIEVDDPENLQSALERASERARTLGIAGGDGSVSAAAAAARAAGVPLLVVPSGSLNRLASDLGMGDVRDAVAAVRAGEVVRMDAAEIDGRPYVNAAGVGVYPHLVDVREKLQERIGKWPALVVGLAVIMRRARPVELELDGQPRRIWMLFAGNGRYAAAGIAPTNRRQLDDGVLDVRIVDAEHRWALLQVLAASLIGQPDRSPAFEARQVREIQVRSRQGPLRLACDGETFAGTEAFTIRKLEQPLHLLVAPAGKRKGRS